MQEPSLMGLLWNLDVVVFPLTALGREGSWSRWVSGLLSLSL